MAGVVVSRPVIYAMGGARAVLAAIVTAAATAVALRAAGATPQALLTGGGATFVTAVGLGIGAWQVPRRLTGRPRAARGFLTSGFPDFMIRVLKSRKKS